MGDRKKQQHWLVALSFALFNKHNWQGLDHGQLLRMPLQPYCFNISFFVSIFVNVLVSVYILSSIIWSIFSFAFPQDCQNLNLWM